MRDSSRLLAGVDFTSSPSRRKPIVVALGHAANGVVSVDGFEVHTAFETFDTWLRAPQPWFGAFDFPFGLPRTFVDANGLGRTADDVIRNIHARCASRMQWRAHIDAWGNTRPAGQRLLHRRTDTAWPEFSSTSPLQTRYVPVGFMYYEGLHRLVEADVTIPRMRTGVATRVAVEGYPGLLAHELLGRRSYKNDDTHERRRARVELLDALEHGVPRLGVRLGIAARTREEAIEDAGGDRLDALLCLAQAAWAAALPFGGVPEGIDPVEGWIVGMPIGSPA